jgi:hypothetical protein
MNNNQCAQLSTTTSVPQIQVRSHLRGGTLEQCQKTVNDWKISYDKWYTSALKSGKLSPPKCGTTY